MTANQMTTSWQCQSTWLRKQCIRASLVRRIGAHWAFDHLEVVLGVGHQRAVVEDSDSLAPHCQCCDNIIKGEAQRHQNADLFNYKAVRPTFWKAPSGPFAEFRRQIAAREDVCGLAAQQKLTESQQERKNCARWIKNSVKTRADLFDIDGPYFDFVSTHAAWEEKMMQFLSPKEVLFQPFPLRKSNRPPLDFSHSTTYILQGEPGLGKTNCPSPFTKGFLLVNRLDKLKLFDTRHYHGNVIKEFDLRELSGTQLDSLVRQSESEHDWCPNGGPTA